MKIDVHSHIMGREYYAAIERMPGVKSVPHRMGRAFQRADGELIININDDWLDPSHVIKELDRTKVDMRLMSLTTPNLYCFPPEQQAKVARIANDEAVELTRKHPDRIRALASLPLDDIPASLAEIERVAKIREVVGIAIGSNVNGVSLSDDRFEPVWKKINEHRLPVVEHPMFPSFAKDLPEYNLALMMGFYFDTQIMVTRMILNGVFERYPDFPFIVAHTGGGMLGVMHRYSRIPNAYPEVKAKMHDKPFETFIKNLYWDSCAIGEPMLLLARDLVGTEHLLFGTDYPYTGIGTEHVDTLPLSGAEKKLMLGDNAARVFKL